MFVRTPFNGFRAAWALVQFSPAELGHRPRFIPNPQIGFQSGRNDSVRKELLQLEES
jgi:hypothetical protein